jgi:hypothetical protein
MKFKEIQDAVKREIEDFSVEFFTDIPSVINEVYTTACDEIDPGVPNLESVETLGTVTDKAFINHPAESSGKIVSIYNADTSQKLEEICGGLDALRDKCGSLSGTGAISFWTSQGLKIWYSQIPASAVNLEIIFYKNPTVLSGDDDEPIEIPAHLHRGILVHGAAFELFSRIEQEGENEAFETAKQRALFTDASSKFKDWVARRTLVKGRKAWDA